jgi:ribosomal protein L9
VVTVSFYAKANDQGHLFASIHKEEVAEKLQEQAHISIPLSAMEFPRPLKEVGEYIVEVTAGEKTGSFKVVVSAL